MGSDPSASDPKVTPSDPPDRTAVRGPSDLKRVDVSSILDSARSRQELEALLSRHPDESPTTILTNTWPRTRSVFPRTFGRDEFLTAGSLPLYRLTERRLTDCEQCENGGVCEGKSHEGKLPVWREGAIAFEPCPKWNKHLFHQRLLRAGVPEHLLGYSLGSVLEGRTAVHDWLEGYSAMKRGDRYRWLVLHGKNLMQLSRIGASVMFTAATLTNGILVYKNLRLVEQQLQEYFQTKTDYPLERAKQSELVLFDHYDLSRVRPWCGQTLETFLMERSQRPTVLVTPHAPEDLQNEQPMIAELVAQATTYQA